MLGKKVLKIAPPSIQKFNIEDMGKLVAIICCFRDDKRLSHQTEDPTLTAKKAGIAMLIGGALANALAFTGSSHLFSRLFKDGIDAERKRHDEAIERLQKAQIEWVHK